MMLPLRCSDINRQDYQALLASVISSRGDALEIVPGTIIYAECVALARLLYNLRLQNQRLQNQLNPHRVVDPALSNWEQFLGIIPLPTDTLTDRRNRLANKLLMVGSAPTLQAVRDLLSANIPAIFRVVHTNTASGATASIPGGFNITGGSNCFNGPWFSTVASIFIEVSQPSWMNDTTFYLQTSQVYALLNNFLPSYVTYDWMYNSFNDGGANGATITGALGSTSLTGVLTHWNTAVNVTDNVFDVTAGSIIECFDDNGNWQELTVASVQSDNSLTLQSALASSITNQPYSLQGFFLDCDSAAFPYPNLNCKNLDNAGFNSA